MDAAFTMQQILENEENLIDQNLFFSLIMKKNMTILNKKSRVRF
jgi:hypothetical protein